MFALCESALDVDEFDLAAEGESTTGLPDTAVRPSTQHLDVNNDGSVAPLDVLIVINELNEHGTAPVELANTSDDVVAQRRQLDTNRDDFVSPIDALLVINQNNHPQTTFTDEVVENTLAYFAADAGAVETASGLPWDRLLQRNYTQPTAIGFYVQLLANVVSRDLVTRHVSITTAKERLAQAMTTLRDFQEDDTISFKGLLPWIQFHEGAWRRDPGEFGQQISTGDNANLSASIGAAAGAISGPALTGGDEDLQGILGQMEAFLEAQAAGYKEMLDEQRGLFHRLHLLADNAKSGGYHTIFGDEFRSGILFAVLRFDLADSAYTKLTVETVRHATTAQALVTNDGSAFQQLWPLLLMPELAVPHLKSFHQRFLPIALEFARKNELPGLPSAAFQGIDDYDGSAGIGAIAARPNPNEMLATLYPLGPASMINFAEVDAFLAQAVQGTPELVAGDHGYWDSYNAATDVVVEDQIAANVASQVIGHVGEAGRHMADYLRSHDLYDRFLELNTAQAGTSLDVIAASDRQLTFGHGGSGANSMLSTGQPGYTIVDSAFDQFSVAFQFDNAEHFASGEIRIRYRANVAVPNMQLEFKEKDFQGTLETLYRHRNIALQATNSGSAAVTLQVPPNVQLDAISEVVLVLSGGTGEPLQVELEEFRVGLLT